MTRWKVLSLNPPYGSLVAVAGGCPRLGKHIETRDYPIGYRGPLLIHQTKGLGDLFASEEELWAFCDLSPFRAALAALGYRDASELPRGALVAACELTAVHRVPVTPMHFPRGVADDHPLASYPVALPPARDTPDYAFGNYAPGRYAWILTDIRALPGPIPARGMPGLWAWSGELDL